MSLAGLQTHGAPGVGILILQHQNYDKQGFDVVQRAGQHCIRVMSRDGDGDDGIGSFTEDVDSRSDLMGSNFWKADYGQRKISGCAFAWPSELQSEPSNDVSTGPGGGGGGRLGDAQAVPKGSGGAADGRFLPKPVIIPLKTGDPEGDPNAADNDAALGQAAQAQAQAQQQAAAKAKDPNLSWLPPVKPTINPNRLDSGSSTLILGIGGSLGGFGGPGVGTGSRFAQFTGVRSNFSSGSSRAGASFSGVRENFSSGSPKTGATFTPAPDK